MGRGGCVSIAWLIRVICPGQTERMKCGYTRAGIDDNYAADLLNVGRSTFYRALL